jgi:hypothetical protein
MLSSKITSPPAPSAGLTELPGSCLYEVISKLPPADQAGLRAVCSTGKEAIDAAYDLPCHVKLFPAAVKSLTPVPALRRAGQSAMAVFRPNKRVPAEKTLTAVLSRFSKTLSLYDVPLTLDARRLSAPEREKCLAALQQAPIRQLTLKNFRKISPDLAGCSNLEHLTFTFSHSALPISLESLTGLRSLTIEHSAKATTLPTGISQLTSLIGLRLEHCPALAVNALASADNLNLKLLILDNMTTVAPPRLLTNSVAKRMAILRVINREVGGLHTKTFDARDGIEFQSIAECDAAFAFVTTWIRERPPESYGMGFLGDGMDVSSYRGEILQEISKAHARLAGAEYSYPEFNIPR